MPDQTPELLNRLWNEINPGQAPLVELIEAGHAVRRRRRRTWVAAAAASAVGVLGAVALGVGLVTTSDHAAGPSQSSPDTHAGLSPDQAAARVLATLDEPAVRDIKVVPDPSDNPGGLPWVRTYVEDVDARSPYAAAYPQWLGSIVEGAVAELMHTTQSRLSQVIDGGDVVYDGPNGRRHTVPLGMGLAPSGRRFDSPSDAALRARVDRVAQALGLTVSSVKILHPLDSALVVKFVIPPGVASTPGSSMQYTLDRALLGSPTDIEGAFLEFNSPKGRPLARFGWRDRIAGGVGWTAHGQSQRFGFEHG